ncbi:hypothetical protein PsorP6_009377 [Peronosclerospora sorghi]|uniref:Uncharacterized protein n=1 Tax=Peronosclerospora sorghi TaxID=230839 RepID=A0ACC0VX78_9STRA|nr:hypothetical protein PsorP6_009377 [Peronosclerospora sorghi]
MHHQPPAAKKRRHRFQKVEERLSNLQNELTLHAKTIGAQDETSELSFQDELALQAELTTLASFQLVSRALQPLVATTPHLLHYGKKIVHVLLHELQEAHKDSLDQAVQRQRLVPVLKLVTALARELGKEFYPHFATVLPHVVAIIDTKDPELSTHVFKTLTMLFSYLRVQLLADMDAIHTFYFPLLGHTREFVREFAAQTLAVLLRRLESSKAMKAYLRAYLTALVKGSGHSNHELRDGSAKLLFALVKNVRHGFHSRMRYVLLFLLGSFRPKGGKTEETDMQLEQQEAIFEIVYQTWGFMMKHTDAEHAGDMLECLEIVVNKVLTSRKETNATLVAADDVYLSRVLRLLVGFCISRMGKLITEAPDADEKRVPCVYGICTALVSPENKVLVSHTTELQDVLMLTFEAVWRLFPAVHEVTCAQVKAVFTVAAGEKKQMYWHQKLLTFVHQSLHNNLVAMEFVIEILLPNALEFALKTLLHTNVVAFSDLLCQLGEYVAKNTGEIRAGQSLNIVRSEKSPRYWLLSLKNTDPNAENALFDAGQKLLQETGNVKTRDELAISWKFCSALGLLQLDGAKVFSFVTLFIKVLDERLKDESVEMATEVVTLRAELWQLQQIAQRQSSKNTSMLTKEKVEEVLRESMSSYKMLSTFLLLIGMETEEDQHAVLTRDLLPFATSSLLAALRSPAHELRLVALQLLARFERLDFLDSASGSLSGPCDLLDVCVHLELSCKDISVSTEREVVRLLTRLKILCRSTQTPDLYKKIALCQLLGLYHVKFSTIWTHIADAVDAAVRPHMNEFWSYISKELLAASLRNEIKEENVSDNQSAVVDEFKRVCMLEQGNVPPSSATDAFTHHSLLWKGLTKFPELVQAKTKFMVPLFLSFLRDQYARVYVDELDAKRLEEIDEALAKLEESSNTIDSVSLEWRKPVQFQDLTTKTVRGKLVDQLKLFATFHNMKGAFAQHLLHTIFLDLLMKSDDVVSKLALQCLYAFGNKAIVSYKAQLNRLTDSSSFREELSSFKIGEEEGVVLREHRIELLPVLLRVLYSKCVSKKSHNNGDTMAARRAAVLAFLAALEAKELAIFVNLVVWAFDVTIEVPESVATGALLTAEAMPVVTVCSVQPSRILGFLNLLEDLFNQLGVKLTPFIPRIADMLLAILQVSIGVNENDELVGIQVDISDKELGEAEQTDVGSKRKRDEPPSLSASTKKLIRMMTFRRLSKLIDTFDTLVQLQPWVVAILHTCHEAIMHLPNAVIGAGKASALLELLVALGRAVRARQWIPETLIRSVISCLSAGFTSTGATSAPSRGISPEILDAVLQFMDSLLDGDERLLEQVQDNAMSDSQKHQRYLLVPQISFVLEQFVLRFQAKSTRYACERYAGSSRKELAFLCRLAHQLDASKGDIAVAAHDLFQLLLPFLLRNHQTFGKDKENLLEVLACLVPKLEDPKKHVLALARILSPGPNCIVERDSRAKLLLVFAALGQHPALPEVAPVANLLAELNAYDTKRIEETDIDRRLSALNHLNSTRFASFTLQTHLLAPLVAQCLQSMHDAEFSVRSGALAALTTFVELAAEVAGKPAEAVHSPVLNALESLVMPCVRVSLRSTDSNVRRGFVTLLGSLADHYEAFNQFAFVPSDLVLARNQQDPEADFFCNITHIQTHRRRRALQRLGILMHSMATKGKDPVEGKEKPQRFSNATVHSILVPLLLHFVYESNVKSQESLRVEAAACVGSAAGLLGWSHYLSLLRRLLKSIDGHAEMESAIIMTICAVLEHFHFDIPGAAAEWRTTDAVCKEETDTEGADADDNEVDDEDDGRRSTKVQDNMETQILPMLYSYLFKVVNPKKSSKGKETDGDVTALPRDTVSVRVPLALAVVMVLRRLHADTFQRELPKLLLKFVNLLKSKDEAVRVSARTTIVRMAVELGASFLFPIVEELRHTLRDGYMVHVLSFTVHALLEKLPEIMQKDGQSTTPRKPQSLLGLQNKEQEAEQEVEFASPLDACIPSIMAILAAELFQGMTSIDEAAEAAAGGVERHSLKSKMKEARSSNGRSLDSLELLARGLPFLPNPSIHEVVGSLVKRFQATDAGAQATAVLQAAFKRVAIGLATNPSVESSYMFLYAYNVLNSSLESLRPTTEREKAQYEAGGSTTFLVSSWLVSEKSAAATKLLAARVKSRDTARVTLEQQVTGFDKMRQQQQSKTKKQKRREMAEQVAESTAHLRELLNFGVFLVYDFLRKSGSSKKRQDEGTRHSNAPAPLIDPLVPLLMRCANESKNDHAVMNALKCLGSLLPRQEELPALRVACAPLLNRLFKILHEAGAATRNDLVHTCYRTLTALLRQQQGLLELAHDKTRKDSKRDVVRLTEAQLRVLLSFLQADLDDQEHQSAALALLKTIVNSRLVVSEVYDVMQRVGELLVQSDAPGARLTCAAIYQTFLLEYPLGTKRLAYHFKFLVDNLSYEHASGRSAVLEALRSLVSKLPQDMVNARAQFFFLPLVLRVANEDASACRELARTALMTLVRRMGNKELNECILLVETWWTQGSSSDAVDRLKLVGTAAQVTTLLLETRPEFLERSASHVLRAARAALERRQRELETVQEITHVRWHPVYHVCMAVTAWSTHLPGPFELWLETEHPTRHFLDVVVLPLVQYPHAWVRRSAAQLLTSYVRRRQAHTLEYASPVKRLPHDALERLHHGAIYFQRPGRLFAWARAFCKLLEARAWDKEMAPDVLTALPFLCSALEATDVPQDLSASVLADVTKHEEPVESPLDNAEVVDDKEASDDARDDKVEIRNEHETEDARVQARTPTGWLLTRLSYVARDARCSDEVQVVIFKLFAALVHCHDAAFAAKYVVHFLNPLVRASRKGEALAVQQAQGVPRAPGLASMAPLESALLAQEVLHLLEAKLGAPTFLDAYALVQRKLAARRAARKLERKTQAVSDPQWAATLRIEKNEHKRRTKQMRKRKYAVLTKGSTAAALRPTKVRRPSPGE